MKFYKQMRITAILLLLSLSLSLMFTSCGEKNPPATDSSADTTRENETPTVPNSRQDIPGKVLELVKDGKALATIVYADDAGTATRDAIQFLQKSVEQYTGARMLLAKAGDTVEKEETVELLIGDTGRKESVEKRSEVVAYLDFSVAVCGNKLVFSGQNEDIIVRSIYWFVNNCVKKVQEGSKSLYFSSEQNYLYRGSYPMENLKLFEKAFSDYRIVIPKNADITVTRFANYFNAYLCNRTGTRLPIVTDSEPETACEIRIGNTARTKTTVKKYEYAVTVKENAVEIVADSLYGYEAAYTYAINDFLTSAGNMKPQTAELVRKDISTRLSGGTENILNRTGDVRVMFHNVWGWNESATNPTEQRNQMLAATYLEYLPDVLCLQEYTAMMRNSAKFPISKALADAGYEELKQDEINGRLTATPIFYRTEKLELLTKGQHKITVGGGDDKFVTWGVFRVRETGKTFAVLSVHLAYQSGEQGDTWRYEQVGKVTDIVNGLRTEYNCPVIVGGDMNCTTKSAAYQRYLENGFQDVQNIANKTEDSGSHFGYPIFSTEIGMFYRPDITNTGNYADGAVDHIFYGGKGLLFNTYDIVTDNYVMCASDHAPTLIEFSFEESGTTTDPSQGELDDYTWRY